MTADSASELHRLLTDTGVGLPIAADDGGGLYAAIARLLSDAPLRQRLGIQARRYAVDQLGKEAVLKELMHRFGAPVQPVGGSGPALHGPAIPPASDGPLVPR